MVFGKPMQNTECDVVGKIGITNTDGTVAPEGMYYIRFNKGWLPREALVEAGTSEVPFRHFGDQPCLMQPNMKLGVRGAALVQSDLAKAQFKPTSSETTKAVEAVKSPTKKTSEPPPEVLTSLIRIGAHFCNVVAAGAPTLT